jgi:hypothetical protein
VGIWRLPPTPFEVFHRSKKLKQALLALRGTSVLPDMRRTPVYDAMVL